MITLARPAVMYTQIARGYVNTVVVNCNIIAPLMWRSDRKWCWRHPQRDALIGRGELGQNITTGCHNKQFHPVGDCLSFHNNAVIHSDGTPVRTGVP
ncbi:unnamed protein product [Arctogadus glacialis]